MTETNDKGKHEDKETLGPQPEKKNYLLSIYLIYD